MRWGLTLWLFINLICGSSLGHAEDLSDEYLRGYTEAVLKHHYGIDSPVVTVEEKSINVELDDPGFDEDILQEELIHIPQVRDVNVKNKADYKSAQTPQLTDQTGFLPEGNLFRSLAADPRWPQFSAKYLYYIGDSTLTSVGSANFGETMGIYRSKAFFDGLWQLNVQAGVFSIFDLDSASHDLINTDFFVGVPLTYMRKNVSAMLRIYHQSSHLGDEYILRDRTDRINLSYEVVDGLLSWDPFDGMRVYGGGGYIFHRIPSDLKPGQVQLGTEIRGPWMFYDDRVQPLLAIDAKHFQEHNWDTDLSVKLGLRFQSWEKFNRHIKLYVEYFTGHSPNGQFYQRKIEYAGLGLNFEF